MAFQEDLDIFLDSDDFAVECKVDGITINGIFERKYVEVSLGHADFSGVRPTLYCKSTDLASKREKTAIVDNVEYTVVDIQPDGTGFSLAVLMEN